jgi:hypothetical protein
MFRFALTDHICDARPSMRPVTFDWNSRYRRCPKLRPRDADRFFLDPYITPSLNAFRAELGLRPVRRVFHSWLHSPRLTIGIFPDWFPPHSRIGRHRLGRQGSFFTTTQNPGMVIGISRIS